MLSRNPEGKLCLEDGEGRVPLDMEDAVSLNTPCLLGKRGEVRQGLMVGTWRRNVYRGMYGLDRRGVYDRGDCKGIGNGSSTK